MRGKRTLSGEERRLWSDVARTTRPLPGRVAAAEESCADAAAPAPLAKDPPRGPAVTAGATAPTKPRPTAAAPALHPIERPVRRRLARGRIPIDGRIDLHDSTEAVAHWALLAFLRGERDRGARHVLVITGRGASFGSRGALKRAVPHWFETGPFRELVAGFEPAERRHGGAGAFYVRLRRR